MIINNVDTDELLNFKYVLDIIKEQFAAVLSTDPNYYSQYKFEIENEQYYVPDEERESDRIYIVIKFSPAQIDYGQDIIPLTIEAISEQNGLTAAQRLLMDYAQIFNLNTLLRDGKTIYQNYTSPNVVSNFNSIYDGFRSVLILSGVFLLSSNINRVKLKYYDGNYAAFDYIKSVNNLNTYVADYVFYNKKIYRWVAPDNQYEEWNFTDRFYLPIGLHDEYVYADLFETPDEQKVYMWDSEKNKYVVTDGEEIDILNFNDNYDATPDTQPYYERNNFTDSVVKYGTYSFTLVSFLIKSTLHNKILKMISRKRNVNNNFFFKISFDEEELNMPLLQYKCIHAVKQQNKGEMPSIAISFTN